MSRRKTEKDYYELAEKRDFKWVGEVLPKNTHTKTWWKCKNGHEWEATYNALRHGNGCPYCSGNVKKTKKDYYALARCRGLKWIGGVLPKNNCMKTKWECKKEHKWETTYSSIKQGRGCPYCAGVIKKIKKDYHVLAEKRGFKWAGFTLPKNANTKTLWKCEKGHKWQARYNDIQQGSGCPYCVGKIRKTKKDYHNLAKRKGFQWVGINLPKNIQTKTLWECKKEHRWEATYGNISYGSGCPYCAGLIRRTEEDYHELAETRGFKWIGKDLPKNASTKTLWQCNKKHKWLARYADIYRGRGCPYCQNRINGVMVSKPQIKLDNLLYGSLNYPESRYHIDVAIMRRSQKIAVEYDCQYWHQDKEEHDAERDMFLISRGWKILHIKSNRLLPTRKQLSIVIDYLLETNDCIVNLHLEDWKF